MDTPVNTVPTTAEEKLNFKKIFPIFIIVLIDLMGMTIIIPLMPLYAASFGATAFMIGLLGATYPIMQFIGAPVLGRLSDRYGRKTTSPPRATMPPWRSSARTANGSPATIATVLTKRILRMLLLLSSELHNR